MGIKPKTAEIIAEEKKKQEDFDARKQAETESASKEQVEPEADE